MKGGTNRHGFAGTPLVRNGRFMFRYQMILTMALSPAGLYWIKQIDSNKFVEGRGTTASDSSGNGNTGTWSMDKLIERLEGSVETDWRQHSFDLLHYWSQPSGFLQRLGLPTGATASLSSASCSPSRSSTLTINSSSHRCRKV